MNKQSVKAPGPLVKLMSWRGRPVGEMILTQSWQDEILKLSGKNSPKLEQKGLNSCDSRIMVEHI